MAWYRRTKNPTCSRQCNGKLRGAEWKKYAAKGRAAWTEESLASYHQKMSGPNNPAWKGGVTYRKAHGNYIGAKYVRAPNWAKPMARADGYIAEHRLVMATMCGRLLSRAEVVNHKDHNPRNNNPKNLELWPTNGDHKRAEHGRCAPGVANQLSLTG